MANVDMLDVEAAIRTVIVDVKPLVILTFEPHGGYYHPDHSPNNALRPRRTSPAASTTA